LFSTAPVASQEPSSSAPVRVVREGDGAFSYLFFFSDESTLVAVLHMNDPNSPVNLGNKAFNDTLPKLWAELQADKSVKGIVFYSEKVRLNLCSEETLFLK
jgi:enoyl-CoA hydratase/carnithine racemase